MIRTFEAISLRAWPAFEEQVYDGWVLRFSEGYTKRANSVNPLYPSALDLFEKIVYCEKAYADHGLPAVFKLTQESTPSGLDRELEARGYDMLDETSVRTVSLENGYTKEPDIAYYPQVCEAWVNAFARCAGIGDANTVEKLTKILRRIPGKTIFAYIEEEDSVVACGLGVLDRGYLGCFDIVVDAMHRRRGYGRRIMEGLLAEEFYKGAVSAYLQVVVGNQPAEKLYDSLGFRELYRYWYREKAMNTYGI